jgi:lipopolysaccharide export system protein LptA
MSARFAKARIIVAGLFVAAISGASLNAQQQPGGPPNALQGFSQNRGKPINIHSATLEVRDKAKVATFSGDVHLVQGDTTLRSKTLVVFYEDDPGKSAAPAQSGQQSGQQIKRVEAKGGVIVVQKDQTATGDSGVFDMHANTVMLLGNVVISQGPNVVKGDRLTVDLTTGVSRVECDRSPGQCRVQALIQPGSGKPPDGHPQEGRPPEGRPRDGRPQEGHPADAPGGRPQEVPAGRDPSRARGLQPSGLY